MNPDFVDLLRAFNAANVRFLVVGAYALALYGRPRATGDLDIWIDATADNAARVMEALAAFGASLAEVSAADFAREGVVYQIGIPPGRIDILTELTGLVFDDAWAGRLRRPFGSIEVDFMAGTRSSATSGQPVARRISETSKAWSRRVSCQGHEAVRGHLGDGSFPPLALSIRSIHVCTEATSTRAWMLDSLQRRPTNETTATTPPLKKMGPPESPPHTSPGRYHVAQAS